MSQSSYPGYTFRLAIAVETHLCGDSCTRKSLLIANALRQRLEFLNAHYQPVGAEFDGERIVEGHMERMGGKEQLLQQMYSAMATNKDDTVNLVLRSYGTPWAISPLEGFVGEGP